MGLAASQARFLGITLRKANCEFKSTQLAEQRLQISNQLSDISQEYSNALNSTKLIWSNDATTGDYGLSYSLLMLPSAANDYNPYLITTKSGAIVLNSAYKNAAEAARIDMGGGIASEEGRKAFISTLATDNTLATSDTATEIIGQAWNRSAGLGATPNNKTVMEGASISDIVNSADIGGVTLDWLQMFTRGNMITEIEEKLIDDKYKNAIISAKLAYNNTDATWKTDNGTVTNTTPHTTATLTTIVDELESGSVQELVKTMKEQLNNPNTSTSWPNTGGFYGNKNTSFIANSSLSTTAITTKNQVTNIVKEFARLKFLVANSSTPSEQNQYQTELNNLKKGKDQNGEDYADPTAFQLIWAYYDKYENVLSDKKLSWGTSTSLTKETLSHQPGTTEEITSSTIKIEDVFQTSGTSIEKYNNTYGYQYTLVENGIVNSDENDIRNMTIADLLTQDIVLMTRNDSNKTGDAVEEMEYHISKLMDYIASVFGYGHIGTGLNIDESTDDALNMALASVKKKFLKAANAIYTGGTAWSNNTPTSCITYQNACNFNRIGSDNDKNKAAINLSNMVSAFLTYFDNYLRGTDSAYVVGKGNNEKDGEYKKTFFVTDDPNYIFLLNQPEPMSVTEKMADFYDQLYNNLCAYGWRLDDSIDHSEYLESAIKNGRYSISALNEDGYFYQTRYNNAGYMKEVTDKDAIARAEVIYNQKKAELTYKEDLIDVKTKKLDAEIAELTTEITSVQSMIKNSIEKTFQMFQN